MPMRTWLPLTASTVTVMSVPIITDSCSFSSRLTFASYAAWRRSPPIQSRWLLVLLAL